MSTTTRHDQMESSGLAWLVGFVVLALLAVVLLAASQTTSIGEPASGSLWTPTQAFSTPSSSR